MKQFLRLVLLICSSLVYAVDPIVELEDDYERPYGTPLNIGDRLKTSQELYGVKTRSSLGCIASDIPTTGLTISQSGKYCLTRNITFASTTASVITISASNVELDLNGFAIIGPESGTGKGIVIGGSLNNIRIRNGVIENMGSHGISIPSPNVPRNIVIERLQIRNNGSSSSDRGINIFDGVNIRIQDVQLDSNAGDGIYFFGGDSILVLRCQTREHTASGRAGYYVANTTNELLFKDCMSSRDAQGFYLDFADETVVDSCIVYNTTSGAGITIGQSTSLATIKNSDIHFGGGTGIDVQGGNIVIENNNIIGNADGIEVRLSSTDTQIINNRILSNSWGIEVLRNDCTIRNNIISENTGGIRLGVSGTAITGCQVIDNVISNNAASGGISVENITASGYASITDNKIFGNSAYGISDTSSTGTRRYYRNIAKQNSGASLGYDYTSNIPSVRDPDADELSFGNSRDAVVNVGVIQP